MKYTVYKHTNLINGKVYVGITARDTTLRWKNGKGYSNNKHFQNAILKYGWDNFTHEILFTGLTKEEACQKEIELIAHYRSDEFEHGYNRSSGGEAHSGCKHTVEARKRMSEAHRGKKAKPETISKMRERMKGVNHPFYGKHLSKEHKLKISESGKGKHHHVTSEEQKRKISESRKGLKFTEEHRRHLSESSKRRKAAPETIEKMRERMKGAKNHKAKKVLQYSLEDELIKEWDCISDAERETGANRHCIKRCCEGTQRKAGGYKWKYPMCTI